MQSLRSLRNLKKLSQSELAELLGVSLRTVQNWEQGKSSMTLDNAQKVAAEFNISVQNLIDANFDSIESINRKLKENRTNPGISDEIAKMLNNIPSSEIILYIVSNESKFQRDPNYQKFLEEKTKDGVIKELVKLLRNGS